VSSLFDLPFEEPPRSDQTPPPESPSPRRVLTVADLNLRIRSLLEDAFIEVWVEGELSNSKVWNTGHMYFTL
jgi:exodeoxyribonuclease VII large subunit